MPWLLTTVVGAACVHAGFWAVVRQVDPIIQGDVNWFGAWLLGVCVVAVIARISVGVTRRIFFKIRIKRFRKRYVRPFLLFAMLRTPELEQGLGAPPGRNDMTPYLAGPEGIAGSRLCPRRPPPV